MRIELLYSPDCKTYRKTLNNLEYIIAEERLPIPVELVECEVLGKKDKPAVRINGVEIQKKAETPLHCFEHVREAISKQWSEIYFGSLKAS